MSGERDWSAYWRSRGEGGEAFAGEGVEQHPALKAYWDAAFASGEGGVLDLACGAGSLLRRAFAAGRAPLIGADVSAAALALLADAVPGVRTVACSADAVPLPDGTAEMVTSQFGFEYAGPGAAGEIARLTAPGGRVAALVHYAGGAIEAEVTANADRARAVTDTGFIEASRELIEAEFSRDAARIAEARAAFVVPERALAQIARGAPRGLAAHLHGGFRQLYERRVAYDLGDIIGWLDGMAGELAAYEGRMATMRAAARDEAGMARIARVLAEGGLTEARYEAFTVPGDAAPMAWSLTARRA